MVEVVNRRNNIVNININIISNINIINININNSSRGEAWVEVVNRRNSRRRRAGGRLPRGRRGERP